MKRNITVGELRKALKNVPDDTEVMLVSDTGVDQGEGEIIIESAEYVSYSTATTTVEYFGIYVNDIVDDEDEEDEEDEND